LPALVEVRFGDLRNFAAVEYHARPIAANDRLGVVAGFDERTH
jgi:hypothetical protein